MVEVVGLRVYTSEHASGRRDERPTLTLSCKTNAQRRSCPFLGRFCLRPRGYRGDGKATSGEDDQLSSKLNNAVIQSLQHLSGSHLPGRIKNVRRDPCLGFRVEGIGLRL